MRSRKKQAVRLYRDLVLGMLGLAVVAAAASQAAADSPNAQSSAGQLHDPDARFFLQLREQMQAVTNRQPPPGGASGQSDQQQQQQWFLEGLRQAAARGRDQDFQGRSSDNGTLARRSDAPLPNPPWPGQSSDWLAILRTAHQLDQLAFSLETQRLWDEAQSIRRAADSLRQKAQSRAQRKAHTAKCKPAEPLPRAESPVDLADPSPE